MTVQLADLVDAPSADTIFALLLSYLQEGGFPTTAWQPGSVPLEMLHAFASTDVDAWKAVAAIAQGGYLDTASGDWLTLLAHNLYATERKASVFTKGLAVLRDARSGGPFTINAGQVWLGTSSGLRFLATTGGTLPKGGSLTVTVQAESPGSAWNVQNDTITKLLTSLPGVLITNPARAGVGRYGGTSVPWVTQTGADEEGDESLRTRCKARWPGLGGGATSLVYQGWALSASTEVQQVAVFEETPSAGQVTIVLASNNAGVSSNAVTAVDAYIQPRRPLCVKVNVSSATQVNVSAAATLTVRAAYGSSAAATVATNIATYAKTLGIGGSVYRAALIEQLMLAPGAVNAVLRAPAADVLVTPTQIANVGIAVTVVGA